MNSSAASSVIKNQPFLDEKGRISLFVRCLASYKTSSLEAVSPIRLSAVGLEYRGPNDSIVCISCQWVLSNWSLGDDPVEKHRTEAPNCPIAIGLIDEETIDATRCRLAAVLGIKRSPGTDSKDSADNCVITNKSSASASASAKVFCNPQTVNAFKRIVARPCVKSDVAVDQLSSERPQNQDNLRYTSSVNETRLSSAALPTSNISVLPSAALPTSNTSVLPHPRHSNYKTLDSRIRSFDGQRIPAGQQPDVLAIAGLFYVGPQDNVRCFHCDGGLKNWQPTDVPWIEHKRWFPRCAYVQLFPDGPTANDARAVRFADPEAASNTSQPRRDFVDFNEPGRVQYRVELREIKARMDTPLVKTVLNMGHSREIVRLAIEKRLTTTGDDFPSAASLIEAVFAMEDPQPSTLHVGGAAGTDNSNIPTHTSSSNSMDNVTAHGPTGDEGVEPAEKLMLENQQLKDSRICKKCRINEVNTVLLPCGHLVCCDQCAKSLSACPACRQLIKGTVKTFIA